MNRAQRRRAAKHQQSTAKGQKWSMELAPQQTDTALLLILDGALKRAIEAGKKRAKLNNRRFTVHQADLDHAVTLILKDLYQAGVIQSTVRVST